MANSISNVTDIPPLAVPQVGGVSHTVRADRVIVLGPSIPRDGFPYVTEISPSVGTILEPSAIISFRIVYPNGAKRGVIVAKFPLSFETIHNGDVFSPAYAARSSIQILDDGARYTLGRVGGWPAAPTIWPLGYDIFGNED